MKLKDFKSNCNKIFILLFSYLREMNNQKGNFLLQTLLALGLITAFMPFFTNKIINRDKTTKIVALINQIDSIELASRIYVKENINNFQLKTYSISGNDLVDIMESYGMPLGFVPKTTFNQDISLLIIKDKDISIYLKLSGGNLNTFEKAQLKNSISNKYEEKNGDIYINIPIDEEYSDIVNKFEKNNSFFMSDLNMGNFSIENIKNITSENIETSSLESDIIKISNMDKNNTIDNIKTDMAIFKNKNEKSPLNIIHGTLNANNINTVSISKYGDSGNLFAKNVSAFELSMEPEKTSFSIPTNTYIKGNLISNNINYKINKLIIKSSLSVINKPSFEDYKKVDKKYGIDTEIISTSNITLKKQTSNYLKNNSNAEIIFDIRPSSVSFMKDINANNINNNFKIIVNNKNGYSEENCSNIIKKLNVSYREHSLSQNIICQYIFWRNLEEKINEILD